MIARAQAGSGFSSLLAYLMRGKKGDERERVEWTSTRGLPFDNPSIVPAMMQALADQAPRVQKPVYHLSISLDPKERLDRAGFEKAVDRTLRDLGLEEHQAILVAHNDREHQHVHVVVNRVNPETSPYKSTAHSSSVTGMPHSWCGCWCTSSNPARS